MTYVIVFYAVKLDFHVKFRRIAKKKLPTILAQFSNILRTMTPVNQLFLHYFVYFLWFFNIFHVKMTEKFITKWWQPFFLHNSLNIFVIFSNVLATFTAFFGFHSHFYCLHSRLLCVSNVFVNKKISTWFWFNGYDSFFAVFLEFSCVFSIYRLFFSF